MRMKGDAALLIEVKNSARLADVHFRGIYSVASWLSMNLTWRKIN